MSVSRLECEVKLPGTLALATLLELGGELLGQGVQKDVYLAGLSTWRIREEKGQFTLTRKEDDLGSSARVKGVSSQVIEQSESDRLIKANGVRALVCKQRTWVRLRSAIIRLDDVEHLGQFVEISDKDEPSLDHTLALLGVDRSGLIKQSYLELMIARSLPRWIQSVLSFHEHVGELAFGITSGILTTVGVLVGVESATDSTTATIAALVSIAVADSCSDAFGMYMAKVSERGTPPGAALRHALATLAGKAFLPLTFIVPLLLFPRSLAVAIDLMWGAVALAVLSAEQAIVEQQSIARRVGRNLLLAVIIVVNSMLAGWVVARYRDEEKPGESVSWRREESPWTNHPSSGSS